MIASAGVVYACHVVRTTRAFSHTTKTALCGAPRGEWWANNILLGIEMCVLVVRTDEYVISRAEIFFGRLLTR